MIRFRLSEIERWIDGRGLASVTGGRDMGGSDLFNDVENEEAETAPDGAEDDAPESITDNSQSGGGEV